jgi:hypothetical protein
VRKGDVRGWASEQDRVARREKGRRSGVLLPDSDFSASESPSEALASEGVLYSMQDLAVTEEQYVLETLAEEEHSLKASSFAPMHCSLRCFPHPFCPTCPPHQIEDF